MIPYYVVIADNTYGFRQKCRNFGRLANVHSEEAEDTSKEGPDMSETTSEAGAADTLDVLDIRAWEEEMSEGLAI